MITLHFTPVGVIKEKNNRMKMIRFGDDIEDIAENLYNLYVGKYSIDKLLKEIKGEDEIIITSELLYQLLSKIDYIRSKIRYSQRKYSTTDLLIKTHVAVDSVEATNILRDIMKRFTEEKLKDELMNKDLLIVHAIDSYDEYSETINLFYERLREWYGLYFPELSNIVTKIDGYANLIATLGRKENYSVEKLVEIGYDEKKAKKIFESAIASKGTSLEDSDIKMIMIHAETLKNLIKTRNYIEEYLEELLLQIAPNITALAGSKLAARLIAKAGGIRKLAMFPASTIQLLGAEKALFLALKKKGKPPKHGIIFQHPFISQSPKAVRGKIARVLAGKLTIAARVDAFGGEFIGDKLSGEVGEKVDYLKKVAPNIKKKKKTYKKKGKRRGKRR